MSDRDGPFGRGYKWRRLTPAQCRSISIACSAGVAVTALAAEYGVSTRTIYRAASYGRQQWQEVRVGDWKAEFVLSELGPVRCTAWVAA